MRRRAEWLCVDCHVHSTQSDGSLSPAELVDQARGASLDYIAATEHNEAAGRGWTDLAGTSSIVLGEEITTAAGHWLALGLAPGEDVGSGADCSSASVRNATASLRAAGGVSVAAHPFAPFPGGAMTHPLCLFDLVEVWNGQWDSDHPWQADNEAALRAWAGNLATAVRSGERSAPAIGNSDTHLGGQIGRPQTVVRAPAKRPADLLDALRRGCSWIAAGPAVGFSFTARVRDETADIGDTIGVGSNSAITTARVRGVDHGRLSFINEDGPYATLTMTGGHAAELTSAVPAGSRFIRVEVRFPDHQMAILSNPIHLQSTTADDSR